MEPCFPMITNGNIESLHVSLVLPQCVETNMSNRHFCISAHSNQTTLTHISLASFYRA